MDILFNFGGGVEARNGDVSSLSSTGAFVVGNMFSAIETRCLGKADLFGIRFKAAGLAKVIRVPLYQFNDVSISCSDLEGICPGADQLSEMAIPRRIHLMDRWLLKHLSHGGRPEPWEACLSRIMQSQGDVNIYELSREVGISQKQLERKFVANVGPTPKQFAQLLRFRNLCNILASRKTESLMSIAFDMNFTDHAHLTRFFQKFALRSPTEFLRSL